LSKIDFEKYKTLYGSAISSIFKAIMRAENRFSFCDDFLLTGFLSIILPELETGLKGVSQKDINSCVCRDDLINLVSNNLRDLEKNRFNNKIACLKSRSWE
jgi:hypothetical protein